MIARAVLCLVACVLGWTATIAIMWRANPEFRSMFKKSENVVILAVVGFFAFVITLVMSCASAPPVSPAKVAHKSYVAAERACNAYQEAVRANLIAPDENADRSCSIVQAVCSEP